jgi:NADH-quinone oxidoreductase subunit L
MMIGTLAITGVGIPLTHIGFAGFLSKDAVIESAWVGSNYAYVLLVVAACMTSFYSWRLMFMTFWGKPRGDHHAHDHAHESPMSMLVPLGALALGAVFSGMIWYNSFFGNEDRMRDWFAMTPAVHHEAAEAGAEDHAAAEATGDHAATEGAGDHAATEGAAEAATDHAATEATDHAATETTGDHGATVTAEAEVPAAEAGHAMIPVQGGIYMGADNTVIHQAHEAPWWVKISPFVAMLLGFGLAWLFYIRSPDLPGKLATQQAPLYRFLLNKWYFDEVYEVIFVRPANWLGRFLWKRGDGNVIDGTLNGVAMGIIPYFTRLAGRFQSGYIFTYAFAMVVGIGLLLTWMVLGQGAQ